MLVIFSGSSGVGKNTVIENLMKNNDSYAILPTCTTRAPRPNEYEGHPYHFITDEEFNQQVENGEFYEHEHVHNYQYGTSRVLFKKAVESGKILLKDIDVKGTLNLKKLIKDAKIVSLFFKVQSREILEQRLIQRQEKEIEKRLERYDLEQTYQNYYDYIITNNDLEVTTSYVRDLIRYEKEGLKFTLSKDENTMDQEKIDQIAEGLRIGNLLSPIKIRIENNEIKIIDGNYRYLASLRANKQIAKEIVD